MPVDRKRYPPDWPVISLARRSSAGWRCEWCGAAQGQPHPLTGSKVVLTVAHLGVPHPDGRPGDRHDKADVRAENLAALCQCCHLNYDRADHLANRWRNAHRRRQAAGQLVLEYSR